MKISSLKIGAVIPVAQYANISPEIEIQFDNTDSVTSFERGRDKAIGYISELFSKYSEKGGLVPKEILKATGTKKSFNEDLEVAFEPIQHTYLFENAYLTSATEYIKRFYKPFDAETLSGVLESKWLVKAQVIKDIWDGNGDLTSSFGNVVHKAIEFYHNYREAGNTIATAKGETQNYVIPKHPILKSIIEGFIALDKRKGKIVSEVLVTDVKKGICGHADAIEILNEKKKICRIGDIKVNIGSEEIDKNNKVLAPFDKLPANKLSKYQLQMSIYANMLEASGWTVEGLDVYVYEYGWKHYELPVLQVI